MVDIGDVSGIRISAAISGGAPSGQIVYLETEKLKGMYKSLMKITKSAGGISFSSVSGKRDWANQLSKCYVRKYGAHTNTSAFNEYLDFFKSHTEMAESPIYLFVYDYVDTDYVKLGDGVDYLKGYVTDFPWIKEGNLYYFDLQFKEVTVG